MKKIGKLLAAALLLAAPAVAQDYRMHVCTSVSGTSCAGSWVPQSGTSAGLTDTELPTAAALADNTATPTVPGVGAYLLAYDGTNFDFLRYGPAGTAAATALTVQGVASMTPILVSGTGTAGSAASAVTTVQGVASMTPIATNLTQVLGAAHSATNPVFTQDIGSASVVSGIITVATAGTSVQGASNTVKQCWFSGPATNTGQCFLAHNTGDHRVNSLPILETASIGPVSISNTNLIWADCITSGDIVAFFCTN